MLKRDSKVSRQWWLRTNKELTIMGPRGDLRRGPSCLWLCFESFCLVCVTRTDQKRPGTQKVPSHTGRPSDSGTFRARPTQISQGRMGGSACCFGK